MRKYQSYLKIASGVIAIALVIIPFFIYKDIELFKRLGYLGFFIANYLGFGVVIFPFIIHTLNPVLLILVGSVGVTIDEFFAWYAGSISDELNTSTALHRRIDAYIQKYGLLAIFILALIPLPDGFIYAVSGFAAGFYKIPFWKFFLANFLGKFIRTTIMVVLFLKFF